MSYIAAVDSLYALGHELAPPPSPGAAPAPRRKFDLAHMRTLAHALGDPHLSFPSILIAGTNGKGSTAATLSSILTASGARTALYTSPHLVRVNERVQIDASPISDHDFARLYFRVDNCARALVSQGALPHHPSFFEVMTALAFCFFAEQKIDIAVLEVGLGGRLDATNIVEPILSILTDIALDHQEYLGPTLDSIAREKCGILRPHGTLITLPQHPAVNQVIGEVAATLPNLRALSAASLIPPTDHATPADPHGNHYAVTLNHQPLQVDSPLTGHHQQRNLALAITAAEELRNQNSHKSAGTSNPSGYNITNTSIEAGIRNTKWPGRLELIPGKPDLLLDVAHNPAGAWALRAAIALLPESRPRTLLFSCLRDKSLAEMAQILFPLFDPTDGTAPRSRDHILFAPIANPRAAAVPDLLAAARSLDIPAHAAASIPAALAEARRLTPPEGIIIATGSVYLIGDLRHQVITE